MAKARKKAKSKILGLKPGESVRYRSPKTGRLTKFKSDRKLIAEVWTKTKTGKNKGKLRKARTLNRKDKKTKKVIPQKFSRFQVKFLTAKRTAGVRPRQARSVTVTLNSRSPIIDQLTRKGRPIINLVRSYLKREDSVLVYADIKTEQYGVFRSLQLVIGKSYRDDEIIKSIAIELIINPVRDNALRISPKKYAKSERQRERNEVKKAEVTISVAKY